jgi:hypothetical protein
MRSLERQACPSARQGLMAAGPILSRYSKVATRRPVSWEPRFLDDGTNQRPTAGGLQVNALQLTELLTSAFDRVGNLVSDLLRVGPGVGRDDQRLLDRELRILEPPDILIGPYPPRRMRSMKKKTTRFFWTDATPRFMVSYLQVDRQDHVPSSPHEETELPPPRYARPVAALPEP